MLKYKLGKEFFIMAYTIMIDPGHGGSDPGAVYNGRPEKDDVLRLGLEVGKILEGYGFNVLYTRADDVYESPYKKAQEGNEANADYFVSIHRNSSLYPNQYDGVETLVYSDKGRAAVLAKNINNFLVNVGYRDLGIEERKKLIVLNSTKMPAVLIEVGFINSEKDNTLFDNKFEETAYAIADGIAKTIYPENY